MWNAHYDEDRTDDDALGPASENGVRYHRQRLVHNHVRKEECDEQTVSILADWLDLVCVHLLLTCRGIHVRTQFIFS